MASVNKHLLSADLLRRLYVDESKSLKDVSRELSVPVSTIRYWLIEFGLLRSKADAIRLAVKQGKLGQHMKGKKRIFSSEWKENIAAARRRLSSINAKGFSKKPNGYVEHTTGNNKGRSVHVVIMERAIGRRILRGEVVHHIDHDRSNNDERNLVLMSRSEHASLHAKEINQTRERKVNGQFK